MEKFIRHGNFKISDARSGAFFCIPPDKQYILKMVSNVEADFLKTIIPNLASVCSPPSPLPLSVFN